MVRAANVSGAFSYSGIMAAAFGSPGFFLLTVLQFVYPFIGEYDTLGRQLFSVSYFGGWQP